MNGNRWISPDVLQKKGTQQVPPHKPAAARKEPKPMRVGGKHGRRFFDGAFPSSDFRFCAADRREIEFFTKCIDTAPRKSYNIYNITKSVFFPGGRLKRLYFRNRGSVAFLHVERKRIYGY